MDVDANPVPSEMHGFEVPEEIQRALRVNQCAMQLTHAVMMGPIFKAMRQNVAGEDWKPESGETLFGPRLAQEVVDGAFRLADAFELRRADEMRDAVKRHVAGGGEWPPKPPTVAGAAPSMPEQLPLPIINRLNQVTPRPDEMADAMRKAMPESMLQRLRDMTDEQKVIALQASAQLYGVDVFITLNRKPVPQQET